MAIVYVISGTKPNLSIRATDPYAKTVTVSYNTNDAIQNAYNSVRQAFISAYSSMVITACTWSGTGNVRTCQATDTHANVITHSVDISRPTEYVRNEMIGKFVDLYGMSDDNALYEDLAYY